MTRTPGDTPPRVDRPAADGATGDAARTDAAAADAAAAEAAPRSEDAAPSGPRLHRKPAMKNEPEREARLAEALRANLRRRKAAGKAGASGADDEETPDA